MNKYKVSCVLFRLPKHQRRKFLGKRTSQKILNHSPVKEKTFFLSADEVTLVWDQLKEMVQRGEIEVRNPDGTLLWFEKPIIEAPPEDKIEKLPIAVSNVKYDDNEEDLDDIGIVSTIDDTVEEKPKKRRGRKKKGK